MPGLPNCSQRRWCSTRGYCASRCSHCSRYRVSRQARSAARCNDPSFRCDAGAGPFHSGGASSRAAKTKRMPAGDTPSNATALFAGISAILRFAAALGQPGKMLRVDVLGVSCALLAHAILIPPFLNHRRRAGQVVRRRRDIDGRDCGFTRAFYARHIQIGRGSRRRWNDALRRTFCRRTHRSALDDNDCDLRAREWRRAAVRSSGTPRFATVGGLSAKCAEAERFCDELHAFVQSPMVEDRVARIARREQQAAAVQTSLSLEIFYGGITQTSRRNDSNTA